jgi:hypothetical protein
MYDELRKRTKEKKSEAETRKLSKVLGEIIKNGMEEKKINTDRNDVVLNIIFHSPL